MVTKKILAEKIKDHLYHKISIDELVDWAENAMMDGEFDEKDYDILRSIIASLGVADVKSFGLLPEDYESFLTQLGYKLKYIVTKA
jgi:hypothetical protein